MDLWTDPRGLLFHLKQRPKNATDRRAGQIKAKCERMPSAAAQSENM